MGTEKHSHHSVLSCLLYLTFGLLIFTRPGFAQQIPDPALPDPLRILRFERLTQADGLSHNRVLSILQDQVGFLWIGTADGLNRYDGYNFTPYKHELDDATTLSGNVIHALCETRDGTLWVGTDRGLDRFDRTRGIFVHTPYIPDVLADLSIVGIHTLHEDREGALWIGTGGSGLSRLDRTTDTLTHYQHVASDARALSDNTIYALYTDHLGDIWVGTRAGLDRYDAATGMFAHYVPLTESSVPEANAVHVIYEDRKGDLWIGTEGSGVQRFDRDTEGFIRYVHNEDDPHSLSHNSVWAIGADHMGRLWVGTQAGLDYFDLVRDRFVHFRHAPDDQTTLGAEVIRVIYEDQGGVVWFGTDDGGLSKLGLAADNFALYRHIPGDPQSLSENIVWSVAETRDGTVWVGSMYEGLGRLDRQSGTVTHYVHRAGDAGSLSNNDVRALLTDHNGMLWIGTFGGGLDCFDPKTEQFVHYRHDPNNPASLGEDHIRVLYEDRSGHLWIGTQSQGVDRFDSQTGIFTHYRYNPENPSGLSGTRVRAILEDSTGRLWLGMAENGIAVLNPTTGNLVTYRHDSDNLNSLGSDAIRGFAESASGELWIATYGSGLNHFDPTTQTFWRYTEKDGLPNNDVHAVLEDAQGFLWLSTNHGLARFDPRTETFHDYTLDDGVQSNTFNYGAAYRSASGEFFFGGDQGLTAFYPDQLRVNAHIPPVVITEFRKFNRTIYTDLRNNTHLRLSYRDTAISFEFAALDYNAPDKNRYAYQLEGQDEDWIDAGTRRHATYTNLKGGNYRFRVKAANSDDVWNDAGIVIPIKVTRPFWETWAFRGLAVLVLTGGILGGYQLRLHGTESRQRQLEHQVAVRTRDIERRRQVAEGLRDILAMLNADRPLAEVLDYITAQACRLLDAPSAALHVFDTEAHNLRLESGYGLDEHLKVIAHLPLQDRVNGTALMFTRQPFVIRDVTTYRTNSPLPDPALCWLEALRPHYQACLCLPVFTADQIYGILSLYYPESREFSEEDISLALSLGDRVSLAIENKQLRQQVEQAAVIQERNRIARELHDSVSQALYGIELGTHTARTLLEQYGEDETQSVLAEPLDYVLTLANAGLAEMRALIFELRPDALEDEGLVAALSRQAKILRVRHQLTVETEFCAEPDLPLKIKETLYRVAQEAVNNILKHAQANRVTLRLFYSGERLVLEVQDNGSGFEPKRDYPGHIGLKTMRERVAQLRGNFDVISEMGHGTIIHVSICI